MKSWVLGITVLVGATIDLAAKAWARSALVAYGSAVDFLPILSLRLTFNEGVSFGLLRLEGATGRWTLVLVTALLTVGLMVWASRTEDRREHAALSLIIAGASANVADRAFFGAVTDFLDLHFGSWHPFVFNLADVWISAGVCLLLYVQLWGQRRVKASVS